MSLFNGVTLSRHFTHFVTHRLSAACNSSDEFAREVFPVSGALEFEIEARKCKVRAASRPVTSRYCCKLKSQVAVPFHRACLAAPLFPCRYFMKLSRLCDN